MQARRFWQDNDVADCRSGTQILRVYVFPYVSRILAWILAMPEIQRS
jgi:hypothetical protein